MGKSTNVELTTLKKVMEDGRLNELLSLEEAKKLSIKSGWDVMSNQAYPVEVTGKEPLFTITEDNFHMVADGIVARENGKLGRIPITYKTVWKEVWI